MKEKRIIYLIMGVSSILILLIGITTAWFEWKSEIDTNVTFNVEGLNITYEGEPTVIKGNLYPTMYMNNTDNIIHNFSLVTTSNIEIHSKISLEIITLPTELNHESFKWNLYKDSTQIASGNFLNASVGTDLLLTPYETITTTKSNYTLYIWIDGEHYDNPLTMGEKTFEFKLKLEASQQDYATAEECFVFDENTQTITDYNPIESYDIHPQCVANAQTNLGITEEEATTFCSGGEVRGYTIDGYISLGAGAELEEAGIITNVVYGGCPADVVIPSSINGVSVTSIGNNAFAENNLTSVVIPDSVTTIGDRVFQFNNLTSVLIPDSVTIIGDYAFAENNLTSVVIPDSVTTIGGCAFCSNNLTSIVIPDSVTSIGTGAFSSNNLISVDIPDSVTTIGGSAFFRNNLTSIVIPDSVTTIGENAFSYNKLSRVYIGVNSNLTETTGIGQSAFSSSNRTSSISDGTTYVDNPNLTTIYNNSGKKFKWYYVTQGRNNYTSSTFNFITGTVPLYTSGSTTYNEVTITTGGNP